jgi:hypothetical protein
MYRIKNKLKKINNKIIEIIDLSFLISLKKISLKKTIKKKIILNSEIKTNK